MDLLKKSLYMPVAVLFALLAILLFLLFIRGLIHSYRTPELKYWHKSNTFKEKFNFSSYKNINEYLEDEKSLFDEIYKNLEGVIDPDPRYNKSNIKNFNRSSEHYPLNGSFKGVALVVHGLSDSPYHMRHIVKVLLEENYYVLNLRLPGHGTAPGALTDVTWQDWMDAVNFGVEAVTSKLNESTEKKLTFVGFSTGGALLLRYTMNEVIKGGGRIPDKLLLFSPAVSITKQAYFADFHQYVSWFPGLERFRWMDVLQENDPFKYQSFPKNAAYQIYKLAESNKKLTKKISKDNIFKEKFPGIIAFQSPYDATVEYKGLVHLFNNLNSDKNKLVLFKENTKYNHIFNKEDLYTINTTDFKPDFFKTDLYIVKNIIENESICGLFKVTVNRTKLPTYSLQEDYPKVHWPERAFAMSHISPQIDINDPYYGKDSNLFPFKTEKYYGELGLLADESGTNFERLRFNPFIEIISQIMKENL